MRTIYAFFLRKAGTHCEFGMTLARADLIPNILDIFLPAAVFLLLLLQNGFLQKPRNEREKIELNLSAKTYVVQERFH